MVWCWLANFVISLQYTHKLITMKFLKDNYQLLLAVLVVAIIATIITNKLHTLKEVGEDGKPIEGGKKYKNFLGALKPKK